MLHSHIKLREGEEPIVNELEGSKGGGGGGGNEAANTLRSAAVAQIVEVVSEGPIVGPMGGAAGIYLNDTPLQNGEDASFNFERVKWDWRAGLPSQKHMTGFGIGAEIGVTGSVPIKKATPVTRTILDSTVDSIRVTIQLPNGLVKYEDNGDSNGTVVEFNIDVRPAGGTWTTVINGKIDGKTTTPYERQYTILRPAAGNFDVRVVRVTEDAPNSKIRDEIAWPRYTAVKEVEEQYNNTAIIGLKADAESFGNAYPTRAYLLKGLIIDVPTNYNPDLHSYTGVWDGTYKQAWTDNPAWVLYSLLTNPRWGLGEFITEELIDKYSFYDAAVYNDQPVTYIKNGGVTPIVEPRFTFNAVITNRTEALKLLQLVAGTFNAVLYTQGGLIRVSQDRPADPLMNFTNSNVENGAFSYSTTSMYTRITSINVSFADKRQNYLPSVVTVFDQAGIDKYGLNSQDIEAFGCTSEAQAQRVGKWMLDTALNQTKTVNFNASYDAFGLKIGDIISVYDENFAQRVGEGRVVSHNGPNLVLDRPILWTVGSKISIVDKQGVRQTRNVYQNSQYKNVISTTGPDFPELPDQAVFFTENPTLVAQTFKIISIGETDRNKLSITAVIHDINKYARVEGGIQVDIPPTTIGSDASIGNVSSIQFKETSPNTEDGIKRSLLISWLPPTLGAVKSYNLRWRINDSVWNLVQDISSPAYELTNLQSGKIDIIVYARNLKDKISTGLSASFTINTDFGTGSTQKPVTDLQVKGGGTVFPGRDVTIEFTNPSNQEVVSSQLKSFILQILNPTTNVVVHEKFLEAVAPGAKQEYLFDFAKNSQTSGGPWRTFKVRVYPLDTNNKKGLETVATLSNPAPALLTNFLATDGIGNIKLTWTQPSDLDFKGVVVWASTTAGFTPSAGSIVLNTTSNFTSYVPPTFGVTWYFKAAAYDDFGFKSDGSDLNITNKAAQAFSDSPGVPSGTAFPTNPPPKNGDSFYRTDLKRLFIYNGTTWVGSGIDTGPTLPATGTEGDSFINTTDNQLYTFMNGRWKKPGILKSPGAPTSPAPVAGDVYYNTTDNTQYFYNGTAWVKPGGASGATNPATGVIGDTFYNTGDKTLYTYNGSAWKKVGIPSAASAPTSPAPVIGDLYSNTTDGKLYRYTATGWSAAVPTADLTGLIAGDMIVGNSITGDKIVGNSISVGKLDASVTNTFRLNAQKIVTADMTAGSIDVGVLNATQLNSKIISTVNLDAYRLTAQQIHGNEIVSNSISTNKINSTELTAAIVNAATVNAAQIIAGKVTANSVGANEIITDTANIQNGVITSAKIGDAQIGTLKIAGGSVTTTNYQQYNGTNVGANGSTNLVDCWVDMGAVTPGSGVVVIGHCRVQPDGNNGSYYLYIQRIRDGNTIGFAETSALNGYTTSFTVTGFDAHPQPGGNGYRLIIVNPGSGPGSNVSAIIKGGSLIATGGKR